LHRQCILLLALTSPLNAFLGNSEPVLSHFMISCVLVTFCFDSIPNVWLIVPMYSESCQKVDWHQYTKNVWRLGIPPHPPNMSYFILFHVGCGCKVAASEDINNL
jgi:hypothetical protein